MKKAERLKIAIKEVRHFVTIITKWPKWKIVIKGTTPDGTTFEAIHEWP